MRKGIRQVVISSKRCMTAWAAATTAVLATSACGGSSGGKATFPSTPSSTPTTTASSAAAITDPREAALAAYSGMLADWQAAALIPDYHDAVLPQHASAQALQLIVHDVYSDMKDHVTVKGRIQDAPQVTQLTPMAAPTEAMIADCADTRAWLRYKASDGSLAAAGPGGRHRMVARVREVGGVWKVTQLDVYPIGSCR